jgi:hypothetical protein
VLTGTVLIEILNDIAEIWDAEQIRKLIAMAAPECQLEDLAEVPESCWPDLAAHHLFRSTVRNVRSYRDAMGSVDQNLAGLLVKAGSIDAADEDHAAQMKVAVDVLNAAGAIPEPRQRVNLFVSLPLDQPLSPRRSNRNSAISWHT